MEGTINLSALPSGIDLLERSKEAAEKCLEVFMPALERSSKKKLQWQSRKENIKTDLGAKRFAVFLLPEMRVNRGKQITACSDSFYPSESKNHMFKKRGEG